jgi:hypothetical protein
VTHTTVAYTDFTDSAAAGEHLAGQVCEALDGQTPDATVVFASSRFDYQTLLGALQQRCQPGVLVGASSAGEFTGRSRGEGTACVLAFRSDEIRVAAGLGRAVSVDRAAAARSVTSAFTGPTREFPFSAALVLTDALAGHADDLVEQLTLLTAGTYQFAGGGAGDDAHFARTHVFYGTEAHTDAVVGLELLSRKRLGVGVGHGWTPASRDLRVTEAQGARLVSLNGMPAAEAFEEHASATGQSFDRAAPLPFFLHNILGIDTGAGHRLRVPLAVGDDDSVTCAAEVPTGARVHIMRTTSESAVVAAERATHSAIQGLEGGTPAAAFLFDCVATRLRMGEQFGFEVDSVAKLLGGADLAGCNTYGQIARADGQFGGFHNCTAVVMILPS